MEYVYKRLAFVCYIFIFYLFFTFWLTQNELDEIWKLRGLFSVPSMPQDPLRGGVRATALHLIQFHSKRNNRIKSTIQIFPLKIERSKQEKTSEEV
jgi:hypothetical protein